MLASTGKQAYAHTIQLCHTAGLIRAARRGCCKAQRRQAACAHAAGAAGQHAPREGNNARSRRAHGRKQGDPGRRRAVRRGCQCVAEDGAVFAADSTAWQSSGSSPSTLCLSSLPILVSMPIEPSSHVVVWSLQAEQSAAAHGLLALFRGISAAKTPGKGNSKSERCTTAGSVGSASAVPAADSESDVERVVREQMERHRALHAKRKRRAVQREE